LRRRTSNSPVAHSLTLRDVLAREHPISLNNHPNTQQYKGNQQHNYSNKYLFHPYKLTQSNHHLADKGTTFPAPVQHFHTFSAFHQHNPPPKTT
jgi:hypothetical protein